MAESQTVFNPLETSNQELPEIIGIKRLGPLMETHEVTFAESHLIVGSAGSCMGCGEATAIRMMLAATGFAKGPESIGVVASTGCNTVYSSTYPYNPYIVPWTNSLFENAPADAMGSARAGISVGGEKKHFG